MDSLTDWKAALAMRSTEALRSFRNPASPADLEQLEIAVGVALPDDYRSFLSSADGQHDTGTWFDDFTLLSAREVCEAWEEFNRDSRCISSIDERINCDDPLLLPVASFGHDLLALDLNPPDSHCFGQVIEVSCDSDRVFQRAPSFASAMTSYIEALEEE